MDETNQKLNNLFKKMEKYNIEISEINCLKKSEHFIYPQKIYEILIYISFLLFCVIFLSYDLIIMKKCLIEMPTELIKAFRAPENCEFCAQKYETKYIKNISPDKFEEKYAYNGGPVIVTDAMENWTAPKIFDYWYFKSVYESMQRKKKSLNCQFFPYKSGLKNLFDAWNMDEIRVNYTYGQKPWYFGWSNCNPEVAKILRQHYDRPYFLPRTSENNAVDWIFIGGHGMGAHMHVDNVRLPSWQAQLKGIKEWILAPPPECYYKCSSFKAVVHPGEIIVLDTNKWYHQTNILSGEISVTIGAEYD